MSLIALTMDLVLGRLSVVTSSTDFNAGGAAIRIQNAHDERLKADTKHCNTGYDLHVGSILHDHRNQKWQTPGANDRINLLPGTAVIIQTEELVAFPKQRFGKIFARDWIDRNVALVTSVQTLVAFIALAVALAKLPTRPPCGGSPAFKAACPGSLPARNS